MENGWEFNEMQHIGVDFADANEVARYDRKQGGDPARERALLQQLGLRAEETLLEFGPGTGLLSREAARLCRGVISVDISAAMLDYSAERARAAGLENITFRQAGFLSYQHQGPPVDMIVSKNALHHLPDFWKQEALCRLAKMLRSGGTLYLRDVIFSFPPAENEEYIERWLDTVAREDGRGWSRTEFHAHIRDEYSTYSWILEGLLTRAGFRIEKEERHELQTYGAYTCRRISRGKI